LKKTNAFIENKAWTLVNPQESRNTVKNQWIFEVKRGIGSQVQIEKARQVAKGYN
jgi:hypothetical protein